MQNEAPMVNISMYEIYLLCYVLQGASLHLL